MARAQLRQTVGDSAGNAIQNALVLVFEVGTTTPVSGMWDAVTGGNAVTELVSNEQSEIVAYFDEARYVDLVVTDNGNTAYYPHAPSQLLSWDDLDPETVAVPLAASTVTDLVTAKADKPVGGVLSGTLPNPSFAVDMATQAELDAGVVAVNAITITYNAEGTVASTLENGVTTTYTYNADGSVATATQGAVVHAFTYNADGSLASVS